MKTQAKAQMNRRPIMVKLRSPRVNEQLKSPVPFESVGELSNPTDNDSILFTSTVREPNMNNQKMINASISAGRESMSTNTAAAMQPSRFLRLMAERPGLALRLLATPMVYDAAWRGDGKGTKNIRKVTANFTDKALAEAAGFWFWEMVTVVALFGILLLGALMFPNHFGVITFVISALALVPVIVSLFSRAKRDLMLADDDILAIIIEQLEQSFAAEVATAAAANGEA